MLVGVVDADKESIERQVSDLGLMGNGKVSCSLKRLLAMTDTKCKVYNHGRFQFQQLLSAYDLLA